MENAGNAVTLPLDGVRVIDFTQIMLGPSCTQMLADYGADVIKIENPDGGDLSRWSIGDAGDAFAPVFCSLNRNKRSVTLDLKSDQGLADAHALIDGADVVVNNFRAGVMDRLGLGWETLSARNPGLIFACATGFGSEGPNRNKSGQDVLAQAYSGAMERRAPGVPMSIYPTALADYAAGMHLFQGILLALLQRRETGRGQRVETALFNSMLAMQMQEAAMWLMHGRTLNWAEMPLGGAFETRDGALVMVGAFVKDPLRRIAAALDLDGVADDPRFATFDGQMAEREALQTIFRDRFAADTTDRWIAALEAESILCAPVRTLAEALSDPQTAVNGMLMQGALSCGSPVHVVGSPIAMSDAAVSMRQPPPSLGEHTEAVLSALRDRHCK